jgi:collagen type I/II/III/V/XI/XXIV/XXVII alpha
VIWTGRRHLDLAQRPDAAALRPVRIAAGAIAPGVPERDLRVSPHHALYLDGLLFEAQALVNGTTITRDMAARYVTYHHVELAAHDIILAEGLAAESYLDTGNRNAFEGGAACDLFPMFDKPSMAVTCVPLVREGAALTTVRARLTQATMTQATLTQVA